MRLHSKLFSLLVVYALNALSITSCDLTTTSAELCGSIGVVYGYYNHYKFKGCMGVMEELLKTTGKDIISTGLKNVEKHVGKETAVKAYKLLRSKNWSEDTTERLLTRLNKTKDLDHFSKLDLIRMVLNYVDHQNWIALMSDKFLGVFDLFSVLDCILQQQKYSSYVVQYHDWLDKRSGPSSKIACDTYLAMDVFTFLIDYSQKPNVSFRQPQDSYDFFEIICDPKNGWNGENLFATFAQPEVQALDKKSLKTFLRNFNGVMQKQEDSGDLQSWNIDLVIRQILSCKGDEELSDLHFKVISSAPNIMTKSDLVELVVLKIVAQKINKCPTQLKDYLDMLTILSRLFAKHRYSLSDLDEVYFPHFVLQSAKFLHYLLEKNTSLKGKLESAVDMYGSFFAIALQRRCSISNMIKTLNYYYVLIAQYHVIFANLFWYFQC